MSHNDAANNQQELIQQQILLTHQHILLTQQQLKNTQEQHCLYMLWKYNESMLSSTSEDEKELFHNLRASVFLELKELRNVHH